jgi:hypothetical protein
MFCAGLRRNTKKQPPKWAAAFLVRRKGFALAAENMHGKSLRGDWLSPLRSIERSECSAPHCGAIPKSSRPNGQLLFWYAVRDSPSLRLGSTAVATCHRHVAKSRLFESLYQKIKYTGHPFGYPVYLVRRKGFEPPAFWSVDGIFTFHDIPQLFIICEKT